MSKGNLKNNSMIRFWLCWLPCKRPRCPQNVAYGPFNQEKQKTKLAYCKQNPAKPGPRKADSDDLGSSSFLIGQLDSSFIQCLCVPAMLCSGHCASSWGSEHRGFSPSSQVTPSLMGQPSWPKPLQPFHLHCCHGLLTDLPVSTLVCSLHKRQRDPVETCVIPCSPLLSTLLLLSDLSPASLLLAHYAPSTLAFLLSQKQAKTTHVHGSLLAIPLARNACPPEIHIAGSVLPSGLHTNVISAMPSLTALFNMAAPTLSLHIPLPRIILLHCTYII